MRVSSLFEPNIFFPNLLLSGLWSTTTRKRFPALTTVVPSETASLTFFDDRTDTAKYAFF